MGGSIYISSSGAVSRLNQLEILANNLANAETVGFKSDQPVFQAALEGALVDAEGAPAPGAPVQTYVATREIATDHGQGPVSRTDRDLDVALQGPGFFTVSTPAGVRYTRAGSFRVSPDGLLATPDGHPVLGEGGPIQAGDRPVRIGSAGQVVDDRGSELGRLRVETFDDPSLLLKEGASLFRAPPDAVGLPAERVSMVPGALEQSNVQSVRELANLMILQRSYEASMQALRADDEATERLLQEMSK